MKDVEKRTYQIQFGPNRQSDLKGFHKDISIKTPIKIGIIDTGIDHTNPDLQSLSLTYRDFTRSSLKDEYGHGTHCFSLITSMLSEKDLNTTEFYVAKVVSYLHNRKAIKRHLAAAIEWLEQKRVHVLLITICSANPNRPIAFLIRELLKKGTLTIAPAGNYDSAIPLFPASIEDVICVSALDQHGLPISRFYTGCQVDVFVSGQDVEGLLPNQRRGRMTGTSQAAAIFTGMLVNSMYS